MSVATLIVGLGRIGMGYDLGLDPAAHVLSHARAFGLHPAFHLLGGVDPDSERRRVLEREYHCPAFADIDGALAAGEPDLVVVAVPTPQHGATLGRLLKQCRPKAVLCEKPLSHNLEEARSMVRLCVAAGVRLFVNYMRRSDPGAIEIKRRLDCGEILSPVKGVVWYSKGLLHNGSHFFNLLEYWLGGMEQAQIVSAGRLWEGFDPEPDFRVAFERGSVLFLAAKEEDYAHHTVELVTPNGRLRYEKGGRRIEWQRAQRDCAFAGSMTVADGVEAIESRMERFQYNVAAQLAASLEGQPASLSAGEDALRTLESLTTIVGKNDHYQN